MSTAEDHSSRTAARTVQQAAGLWRTDLQRQDLSAPGREVVQSPVDQLEGQPPKTFHAGEALTVPAGVIHAVRNVGRDNAAELATYAVEKGKPLLTLAE